MGSKVGFILSLLFVIQLFVITTDIMSIQFIYTNLDAVSVTVGQMISKSGKISDEVVNLVYELTGGNIEEIGENSSLIGSAFRYRIFKNYDALIIDNKQMTIAVSRSVVIGYYS